MGKVKCKKNYVISDTLWKNGVHASFKEALQVAIDRNYNLNVFMRNFADLVRLPDPRKKNINLEMIRSVIKLM